jgi:signal peptidase I
MRPWGGSTESEEDDLDDEDVDTPDEEEAGDEDTPEADEERPPRGRPSPRPRRKTSSRPVKPWTVEDLDEEEAHLVDEAEDEKKKEAKGGFWKNLRRPVFFRARDSWYFEPLLALAIIVLLLVSLYAYTSNWPPVFVVESGSMQHGTADHVGLINTGDLVLVKKTTPSAVIPYVVGEETGYTTYGEYGDVILYQPNGNPGATPVIHRAILYLIWNAANDTYSAPALARLPCGSEPGALYSVSGSRTGCGWTGLLTSITLYDVGWRSADVSIPLGDLGRYSGFITMGDNNVAPGAPPQGETDQASGISGLVDGSWIVGVARGMVPWVGSFKLLIDGNAGQVPPQSWQFLALTIAAIVLAGFGVHYLFRAEGIEDPRRLEEENAERRGPADEEDEESGSSGPPKGSRWKGLRAWLEAPKTEGEEMSPPPRRHAKKSSARTRPKSSPLSRSRGRPRPTVRKSKGLFHRRAAKNSPEELNDDSL